MSRKKAASQEVAVADPVDETSSRQEAATSEPESNGHAENGNGKSHVEAIGEKRSPVRSWSERFTGPVQYQKLTDDTLKAIVFKFKLAPGEKLPPVEALDVMRAHKKDDLGNATGLVFKDTRRHGPAWMIPNDPEGRSLADKIEMQLKEVAEKLEHGQGIPF